MRGSFPARVACLVFGLGFFLWSSVALAAPDAQDAFTQALSKGPVYAALAALAGGFLVSLTPCVYPMVAVTVSVFGARQTQSRWEGMALSAAFVFGIVCMFVPLGVFAGYTGGMFGAVLQNRWVIVGLAALFVAMAASMFGAFDLTLPASLNNRLAQIGGLGYRGAFLLGLACGVLAAPCTGPVLTGILTWIAKTQSAVLGALAMSAFALGLGAPFFVVGTFAVKLPKSGRWMVHVKSLLGIVLLAVALYFLGTTFPALPALARPAPWFLGAMAGLVLLGLALGAVHRDFAEPSALVKLAKGVGVVLVSVAGFLFVSGAATPTRTLSWEKATLAEARAKARSEGRPLLVDFTAAWCVACKELDKLTFAAPEVTKEAGRFVAVKVDATDDEDPKVQAAMTELRVVGLPTVVVFDSRGTEALRYTDFVPADRFLAGIQRVD